MESFNINLAVSSIIKKWKIILIIFSCVFVVTLGYSVLTFDKRYKSEVKILIPKSTLTEEYSKIMLEDDLLENVASGFENISLSDLKKSITVDNSEKKIYVIKLIVKYKNNQIAYEIATDISNEFISKLKTIHGINNAVVSSKPVVAESNIELKDVLGILKKSIIYPLIVVSLFIFLVFVIEYLSGKYVDKKTIESLFKDGVLFELPDFEKKYIKNKNEYIEEQYNKLKSRFLHKYLSSHSNVVLFSTTSSFISVSEVVNKLIEILKKDGKNVYVLNFNKDENLDKLQEYSKKYDLVFVKISEKLLSSYSEQTLNKFNNLVLIEDIEKINFIRLVQAKNLIKFYNIKNTNIIINKNFGILEMIKYKEFEKDKKDVVENS